MTYYGKLCDKSITIESKYNHLKSVTQKMLSESSMRRCIIQNPIPKDIDEIMRKYINVDIKKNERSSVSCVLKLLTTTYCVRYIRNNEKLDLNFFLISLKIRYCLELIKIDIVFLISMKCVLLLVNNLEI